MPEIVQGKVQNANDGGFVLEGHEGWWNYSTKSTPPPPRVSVGQQVSVTFTTHPATGRRYANQIDIARNGAREPSGGVSRETFIVRQNALAHATEVAKHNATQEGGTLIVPSDVTKIAADFEVWVMRDEEEEEPEPDRSDPGPEEPA